MAGKKIIAVFGATGQQGGSVVDIFLNDPKLKNEWSVRAVTRDITKESAKKLAAQGAEVVQADLSDKKTLGNAIFGAEAVFAVTNYWEAMDAELEVKQGKDIVDAAKEAGTKLFIWSSLYDVKKCTGKLPHVYHFDSKAAVEEYARSLGIPAVYFMPGFYMSNLPGQMLRASPPDNTWTLALPMPESAPIPMFDISDTGKVVKSIALNREKVLGKRVLGAFKYMTPKEILEGFKSVYSEAGKTATFFSTPHDAYTDALKGMGMPEFAAIELLENMRLMDEGGYYGGESLDESHALLDDPLTTWEEFMKKSPLFSELKSDE
ncbi:NMRAL1 protein [Ilyonectria robusta]|uniref:NMRAL1 protein n=1 Tax=Ilyonectria robusta TaxID=1079257 RepID=UPI001E8CECBC|nr:NMRAL1 protein [Ilyonectria robusta]KAH8649765.1 NMRAL1 protein [Ilyonectria robusta]